MGNEFSATEKAIARICEFATKCNWDEDDLYEASIALYDINAEELLAMPQDEFENLMMFARM